MNDIILDRNGIRPCWTMFGECLFHRWIEQPDGTVKALIETRSGEPKVISIDSIRFIDNLNRFGIKRRNEDVTE